MGAFRSSHIKESGGMVKGRELVDFDVEGRLYVCCKQCERDVAWLAKRIDALEAALRKGGGTDGVDIMGMDD